MSLKEQLEKFWYKYLTSYTKYPCILADVDINDIDLKKHPFPHVRFEIIEVDTTDLNVIPFNVRKGSLIKNYAFQAKYMLEINVYYTENFNLDKLIYNLSNIYKFSEYISKNKLDGFQFDRIALRDKLKITNVSQYLQEQKTKRFRYQQNFVIHYVDKQEIPEAKYDNIKEVKWEEI